MNNWTLNLALATAVTTTAMGFGMNPASAIMVSQPVSSANLGKWQFKIDATSSDPGGTLVVDILTDDSPVIDPALISDIKGTFTPTGGTSEPIYLMNPGTITPGTLAEGGTATDNKWTNPTPIPNNDIHLTNGGFAFYYGAMTPTPAVDDQYQLFYANNTYKGCWGTGSCVIIDDPTPVPEPLTILGTGVVLGALPVLKKEYAKRNKKKDEST